MTITNLRLRKYNGPSVNFRSFVIFSMFKKYKISFYQYKTIDSDLCYITIF